MLNQSFVPFVADFQRKVGAAADREILRPEEPLLEMGTSEEADQAFEGNLAARQEAREIRIVSQPDGSSPPAAQLEVVKKLETRDRQLRATLARMPKGGN